LVRSIRPRQALKNLSLFAPLIFTGQLFVAQKFLTTLTAAFLFILLTSSIYLLNDIVDSPADRRHPIKKNRPIAAGKLPVPIALFVAICTIVVSLSLGYSLGFFFFLAQLAYLILQISYTLSLKKVIIVDVLAIASGFIIRVYAGSLVINAHMSVWFLLCVVSLALFLAAGKRRAELTIVGEQKTTRKTLNSYNLNLLDSYLAIFATSAWLSYALFTFFNPPSFASYTLPFLAKLPATLAGINKWLMVTIPLVLYGIMRYMNIVYTAGVKAEAPERVLLNDKPLLLTITLWAGLVILILYGFSPTVLIN